MKLQVKVVPGASRDAVDGWLGDALKVRVSSPPERGKANEAVERLLAKTFGVGKAQVEIVSGHGSRLKLVELSGVSEADVLRALPREPA